MKLAALVAFPPGGVTEIFPVFAPVATVAVIWMPLFTWNVAASPPMVTLAAPVYPLPVIVTTVAAGPLVGLKPVITGTTRKM